MIRDVWLNIPLKRVHVANQEHKKDKLPFLTHDLSLLTYAT